MHASKPLHPRDFAGLMLVALIWGVNNLFAMLIVEALPPLFAAGMRFAITALAMAPFLRPVTAGWRTVLGVCVLIGPVHFGVQYVGLGLAHDLSPMVIAMQLWIPASVLAAAIVLGERVTWLRAAGLALAFAGIVGLAFEPTVLGQALAFGLVGLAAAAYGLGAVLVRRSLSINPLQMQGWLAVLSAPLMLAASAVTEEGQAAAAISAPWWIWAMAAFGALASSLGANALMFGLVQRYEVARTTPYVLLSPLIGIGLGVVVLGDPVTLQFAVGAVVALVGVAIVALAERRKA